MIEHKTPESVLAEIKMVRTKFGGTILVTEGDSDFKFLRSFISSHKCYLMPAHGKKNAIDCISLARENNIQGILSFVDSDHDRILNQLPEDEDIVVTDFYDCEILMIMTKALDCVIGEYASKNKLRHFLEQSVQNDLRAALFDICIPIGMFRLLSRRNNYNLRFCEIDFKKFIDARKMQLDLNSLVKCVLANTKGHTFNADDMVQELENELQNNSYEIEQLCKGHDYSEILGISLRQAIGNYSMKIGNRENVERLLRLAYHFELFKRTTCFKEWLLG